MRKYISRLAGVVFSIELNPKLQKVLNYLFVKYFDIDLSEFHPLESYNSLQSIFTRELLKKRKISSNILDVVSPADSKIIYYGIIKSGMATQIKGVEYSIDELLGIKDISTEKPEILSGDFINFYLSPKNYHHFHSPADIYVNSIYHIPGDLYPVKVSYLKKKKVFPKNERVILECNLKHSNKAIYLVFIGALNVGSIKILKENRIKTNVVNKDEVSKYVYKEALSINRGELIGNFLFGSSVVIVSEKGAVDYGKDLMNKNVKFGDTIGNIL